MQISSFLGKRNTVSDRDISDNALSQAVNIDLTDSGEVLAREGHVQAKTLSVSSAYTTRTEETYIVSGGVLSRVNSDLSLTEIAGSSASRFCDFSGHLFTNDGFEVFLNKATDLKVDQPAYAPKVFYENGDDWYVAVSTYVNASGLEGPASPPVSFKSNGIFTIIPQELDGYTSIVYSTNAGGEVFYDQQGKAIIPALLDATAGYTTGDLVEIYDSRLFFTEKNGDYSTIFFSLRHHYHLFNKSRDFLVIPGKIHAIKATESLLFIGTDSEMFAYDGSNLNKLASYGVIEGNPVAHHQGEDSLYIHTTRGICKAFPFKNLTEKKCSLPVGSNCSSAIVNKRGINQFVVMHDNSKAFNQYE